MAGDRRTRAFLYVCTLTEDGLWVPGTYLGKHESLPFFGFKTWEGTEAAGNVARSQTSYLVKTSLGGGRSSESLGSAKSFS